MTQKNTATDEDASINDQSTLLVTVDSLRYDYFDRMPKTQAFLTEPDVPAFATSTATVGSFQSIIGGEYPDGAGITADQNVATEMSHDTKVGRTTNPLLSERYGYHNGFTSFTAPQLETSGLKGEIARRLTKGSLPHQVAVSCWNWYQRIQSKTSDSTVSREYPDAEDVISEFQQQVSDSSDWFGWLHFMEPHHPYNPTDGELPRQEAQALSRRVTAENGSEEDDAIARRLYEQEIQELDDELATLWESLDESTRVVFCADHGECLGRDGRWGHPGIMDTRLLRVPFATKNITQPSGEVISLVDVPTILRQEEHGQGTLNRNVAYATYGEVKAAMNNSHIATGDGTFTFEGTPVSDETLAAQRDRFSPSRVQNEDALKEDLENLGYA